MESAGPQSHSLAEGRTSALTDSRTRRALCRYVPWDALSHGVSEYVEGGWLMPGT